MKNSLKEINNRLYQAEKGISEPEAKSFQIIKLYEQKEKKN